VARLERHLRPGAILVLHDGRVGDGSGPIALAVLAELFARMELLGLRSVSLDQLLAPSSSQQP
jgi:hypothetical protein